MKKAGENDKILPKSSGFPLFSPRYLSGSFSFNTYLFLGSSRLYIYMRWWASLSTHGAHSNGVVGVVKNSLGTSGGSNFRGGMIEISFVEKKKTRAGGIFVFCFFDSFLGFRWLMETVGECLKDERQHFVMMKNLGLVNRSIFSRGGEGRPFESHLMRSRCSPSAESQVATNISVIVVGFHANKRRRPKKEKKKLFFFFA